MDGIGDAIATAIAGAIIVALIIGAGLGILGMWLIPFLYHHIAWVK